mgnify:CR=1 FL=1
MDSHCDAFSRHCFYHLSVCNFSFEFAVAVHIAFDLFVGAFVSSHCIRISATVELGCLHQACQKHLIVFACFSLILASFFDLAEGTYLKSKSLMQAEIVEVLGLYLIGDTAGLLFCLIVLMLILRYLRVLDWYTKRGEVFFASFKLICKIARDFVSD